MPHPIQLVLALSAVAGLHQLAATRTGHLGDVLPHRPCYDAAACTVHKVRVHGCQRISNTGRCHVHRGTELHISIDFTVAFNATTAHVDHQVLGWLTRSPHQRYPFGPWDACQSSGGGLCPLVDGVRRTFRSALLVHQSYPTVCVPNGLAIMDSNS